VPDDPRQQQVSVKMDIVRLSRKRVMTTPPMREIISKIQQAGYEERVENLLEIIEGGVILGIRPPMKTDGHVDLAALEDFSAAVCLFLSQLSLRGMVDNQAIFRQKSAVDVLQQTVMSLGTAKSLGTTPEKAT